MQLGTNIVSSRMAAFFLIKMQILEELKNTSLTSKTNAWHSLSYLEDVRNANCDSNFKLLLIIFLYLGVPVEIRGQIMGIRLSTLVENTKVPFEVPGHTVVVMVKRMQKKNGKSSINTYYI